jgi:hypothetical protein
MGDADGGLMADGNGGNRLMARGVAGVFQFSLLYLT